MALVRLGAVACVLASGCDRVVWPWPPAAPAGADGARARPGHGDAFRLAPLPVQQARAYPETVTGLFVSLADFENAPGAAAVPPGQKGFEQAEWFRVEPPRASQSSTGRGGRRRFVVNITRTGAGALETRLPPAAALVFDMPGVHDFSEYSLVSLAIYSRTVRDDLRITLTTDGAVWRSARTLLKPGWNNVLVDIQRLKYVRGFDLTGVRTLRIDFPEAGGPVRFNLDDVLLINNRRLLTPTPAGIEVRKGGLDYAIRLPHRRRAVLLSQSPDGLWRGGALQPTMQLAGPDKRHTREGEALDLMGRRKIGQVEVLEHNAIRVRVANVWYFPTRAGEWASLDGVRRIRWEYTFYGDGRWVAHVELNNAGGREIGSVRIGWGKAALWAGSDPNRHVLDKDFSGIVERWSCLLPPPGPSGRVLRANYRRPGRLRRTIAAEGVFAPGDADRDGFDESQGCYFLAASRGHCRFTIFPPRDGLLGPVFRIAGRWTGPVNVNTEGLAIRDVIRLRDGSALFRIPGRVSKPTKVEVVGRSRHAPRRGGSGHASGLLDGQQVKKTGIRRMGVRKYFPAERPDAARRAYEYVCEAEGGRSGVAHGGVAVLKALYSIKMRTCMADTFCRLFRLWPSGGAGDMRAVSVDGRYRTPPAQYHGSPRALGCPGALGQGRLP